eukprot:TRINITY_DN1821_c0_g2_i1.p1 TRINITY_DN1821_c0_g2~~TRINITY_DN1821_c0_g2_i1.p1  ORF type:complete len:215 (+),score=56.97 TRINITY_DN1821_c0_g2_i1:90-734(+)
MSDTAAEQPEMPPMPSIGISQMVPLGVSLLAGKVDFEKLGYRHHVEAAYLVVQVLCLCCLGFLYKKIQEAPGGSKKITVPEVKQFGQVVTPCVEMTEKEYDMSKLQAQGKQVVMGAVILAGIYYKWEYLFPLVLQVVMTPMQLVESPLFKLYIFGSDVKRPFPEPNPFGMPQMPEPPAAESNNKGDEKKEAAAITETEKKEEAATKTEEEKKDE